jgi:uncharacterized protein (TIGR02996 family)
MTYLCPLPLPESLVDNDGLSCAADPIYQPFGFARGPRRRCYVASRVFSLAPNLEDDAFSSNVVTIFDSSFSIERQVVLTELTAEMENIAGEKYSYEKIGFGVTARGEVVFATQRSRTFVLDSELETRLATYDFSRGGEQGVSWVRPFASGRLLCLRDHAVVCLSEEQNPTLAGGIPGLSQIAALYDGDADAPTLCGHKGHRSYLGSVETLGDDRFLVPALCYPTRSGNSGPRSYVVADPDGNIVGRLPLRNDDDPYLPRNHPHTHCVGHAGLDGWLMRTQKAFLLFDRDGERPLFRLSIAEDPRYRPLKVPTILGVGHDGELLLAHPAHRTMLVTNPIEDVDAIAPALEEAAAVYRSEHNRLKKALRWDNNYFLGYEARQPPATLKKKKTKKNAPEQAQQAAAGQGQGGGAGRGVPSRRRPIKNAPEQAQQAAAGQGQGGGAGRGVPSRRRPIKNAPAPDEPEPEPKNVEEAMLQRPDDLSVRQVYADSLIEKGDPHGEYIAVCCRLEQADAERPISPRAELEARRSELEQAHLETWLKGWNNPHQLFRGRGDLYGGFPKALWLRKKNLPKALASLDEQLARLPLFELLLSDMGVRTLGQVAKLKVFSRLRLLQIRGSNKHKLGRSTAKLIASSSLKALRTLTLFEVTMLGEDARALIDSLPSLRELRLSRCDISAAKLEQMSQSENAGGVQRLELDSNPLADLTGLSRWSSLEHLGVVSCELDEGLAEQPVVEHGVTSLDLAGNRRLGEAAMKWLVAAFPKLRRLSTPRHFAPAALDALLPLAPSLERLDANGLEPASQRHLVDQLLPRAESLRQLSLQYCEPGLVSAILSTARLEALDTALGKLTDGDLTTIANHPAAAGLERLIVGGDLSDAGVEALAASSQLERLETLEIYGPEVTERAARRVIESDSLPELKQLWLRESQVEDPRSLSTERVTVHGRW